MTSRERVLTTFGHREPDRVPYNLRPSAEMIAHLTAETGTTDFAEHFGHDVRYVYLPLPERPADVPVTEWTPEPNAEAIAKTAQAVAALQARGLAVCGGYWPGVFEHAKAWLGDVRALTDPYDQPAAFGAILDRIQIWIASIYGGYTQAGTDIVWMGDDLGTQRSLVMSPADYRRWYRPRHEAIVQHLRSLRSDVVIAFHCCGHVTPLVGDLIEIGVDVLEAVQAETMDLAQLKREFGRDIAFWGGIGAQSVLARTTPEQVTAGVRETLRVMAPGGGYMAAPCHTLTDEVCWEAVLAFHDALVTYGTYPHPGA
ncbi:MAG: hypothetical protein HPY69_20455 [Armatimonadetes bacterium]|nr:hypothetical protein [Armatimonadota bacterium]